VGLLLASLARVWVSVSYEESVTIAQLTRDLTGSELAPGAQAAAYVALAGVAAIVAVRGWWRVLVGVLVAGAGVAAVAALLPLASGGEVRDRFLHHFGDCANGGCGISGPLPSFHAASWLWVAVLGAVLVILAGVMTVMRGRRWPGLSSRYDRQPETDPVPVPEGPVTDKGAWDALDRGDDPTA
jgi:uncharacterized membrane protein (TIGR02234 family)